MKANKLKEPIWIDGVEDSVAIGAHGRHAGQQQLLVVQSESQKARREDIVPITATIFSLSFVLKEILNSVI